MNKRFTLQLFAEADTASAEPTTIESAAEQVKQDPAPVAKLESKGEAKYTDKDVLCFQIGRAHV